MIQNDTISWHKHVWKLVRAKIINPLNNLTLVLTGKLNLILIQQTIFFLKIIQLFAHLSIISQRHKKRILIQILCMGGGGNSGGMLPELNKQECRHGFNPFSRVIRTYDTEMSNNNYIINDKLIIIQIKSVYYPKRHFFFRLDNFISESINYNL